MMNNSLWITFLEQVIIIQLCRNVFYEKLRSRNTHKRKCKYIKESAHRMSELHSQMYSQVLSLRITRITKSVHIHLQNKQYIYIYNAKVGSMQRRHVSAAYGSQLHLTHPNNVELHHTPVVLEGRSVDMETHLENILQRMVLKEPHGQQDKLLQCKLEIRNKGSLKKIFQQHFLGKNIIK